MTEDDSARLQAAEVEWFAATTEEDFYFSATTPAEKVRRHKDVKGAVAHLTFGRYHDLSGKWVDHHGVIWLGLIASNIEGYGGHLLDLITRLAQRHSLAVTATPTAFRPQDWPADREFDPNEDRLIRWYAFHGFRVVQGRWETRVWHLPGASTFEVDVRFAPPQREG